MFLSMIVLLALQNPPEGGALFYSYVQGKQWEFVIQAADVDRSPRWEDWQDEPPLSPRAAVRSARAVLQKLVKNADDWELTRVAIQPLRGGEAWIYVVDFTEPLPPLLDPTGMGVVGSWITSPVSMVVMMNGRAITPIVRRRWKH